VGRLKRIGAAEKKFSPVAGAEEGTSPRRKNFLGACTAGVGLLAVRHIARLFVHFFLFPADLAPPFSFFIHSGLLLAALAGLLPATALLLTTLAALLILLLLIGHSYSLV
jgi:hypothetical protein